MRIISRVAAPIVALFGGSSRIVLTSFGVAPAQEAAITDEEITFMVDEGVHHGVFEQVEGDIVERALRLDDRSVETLMTPRVDVVWLDVQASTEEIRTIISHAPHTMYPVCRDTADQIVGAVYASDLYTRMLQGERVLTPDIIRTPFIIPTTTQGLQAVTLLRQHRGHLAIIINEHGGMDGILTATDILESLVGALATTDEPKIVQRAKESWSVDGATPIDEVRELFHTDLFPEEEMAIYHTVAGFIMQRLGRIPDIGDAVYLDEYRFEVIDKDGNRIDRVLIQREKPGETS